MTTTLRTRLGLGAIAVVTTVAVFAGWRLFWFMTDDAFIAFRYASNSLLGRGYVWNPAPFVPVEGYTSFAWVVLLRELWAVTGIQPPASANWLALAFGYATLWLGARMLLRMQLPPALSRLRLLWLALLLLGTVSNRTFLTWLSSGLETSLFNFALTWWVYAATGPFGTTRLWQVAASVGLLCLTRPDGLLFAASSVPLLLGDLLFERVRMTRTRALRLALCCVPLFAIPAHIWFRRATYGTWLPNTYLAKYVAPWPESGRLYLLSFALENATWIWALLAVIWLSAALLGIARGRTRVTGAALPSALAVATLLAHAGYYTLVIGGDHFEYRVYSHAVLLLYLSFIWMCAQLSDRPKLVGALTCAFIVCSWPIPWTHWQQTHALPAARFKHRLRVRIAPLFPSALRPPVELFDQTQAWLIKHAVGSRQIEHKIFTERMLATAPPRAVGEKISWDERPIIAAEAVGVIGWSLPNVAVIDQHGLNDRVVARTPPREGGIRKMAHERLPPAFYAECYWPNTMVEQGAVHVLHRGHPLTDADIRACDSIERWIKPDWTKPDRGRGKH